MPALGADVHLPKWWFTNYVCQNFADHRNSIYNQANIRSKTYVDQENSFWSTQRLVVWSVGFASFLINHNINIAINLTMVFHAFIINPQIDFWKALNQSSILILRASIRLITINLRGSGTFSIGFTQAYKIATNSEAKGWKRTLWSPISLSSSLRGSEGYVFARIYGNL